MPASRRATCAASVCSAAGPSWPATWRSASARPVKTTEVCVHAQNTWPRDAGGRSSSSELLLLLAAGSASSCSHMLNAAVIEHNMVKSRASLCDRP